MTWTAFEWLVTNLKRGNAQARRQREINTLSADAVCLFEWALLAEGALLPNDADRFLPQTALELFQ
jgi:hypothetical protein